MDPLLILPAVLLVLLELTPVVLKLFYKMDREEWYLTPSAEQYYSDTKPGKNTTKKKIIDQFSW
jgi:hypothetical protein